MKLLLLLFFTVSAQCYVVHYDNKCNYTITAHVSVRGFGESITENSTQQLAPGQKLNSTSFDPTSAVNISTEADTGVVATFKSDILQYTYYSLRIVSTEFEKIVKLNPDVEILKNWTPGRLLTYFDDHSISCFPAARDCWYDDPLIGLEQRSLIARTNGLNNFNLTFCEPLN